MSDTILQSNDVMDSRRGDIVVGVDGSDGSFAALCRPPHSVGCEGCHYP